MGWFSRKQTPSSEDNGAAPRGLDSARSGRDQQQPPAAAFGADASGAAAVLASLRECVSRLSEGKLAVEAIDPKGHIFDCGYVDSFRSAELLNFVEKQYAVSIPEVQLVGALCTLDAIARHIAGQRA